MHEGGKGLIPAVPRFLPPCATFLSAAPPGGFVQRTRLSHLFGPYHRGKYAHRATRRQQQGRLSVGPTGVGQGGQTDEQEIVSKMGLSSAMAPVSSRIDQSGCRVAVVRRASPVLGTRRRSNLGFAHGLDRVGGQSVTTGREALGASGCQLPALALERSSAPRPPFSAAPLRATRRVLHFLASRAVLCCAVLCLSSGMVLGRVCLT